MSWVLRFKLAFEKVLPIKPFCYLCGHALKQFVPLDIMNRSLEGTPYEGKNLCPKCFCEYDFELS